MATTFESAVDAILSTLKVQWDADTPAITGGSAPTLVYESTEPDLKPSPKDTEEPWARATIRHHDARKVTLNNAQGMARYRRDGIVWVQIFVPRSAGAAGYTLAQRLAMVAQKAYEGKRAAEGSSVVFTKAAIIDQPPEASWWRYDCKVTFYWDELR